MGTTLSLNFFGCAHGFVPLVLVGIQFCIVLYCIVLYFIITLNASSVLNYAF